MSRSPGLRITLSESERESDVSGPGTLIDLPAIGRGRKGKGPRGKKQLRVIRLNNERERMKLLGKRFPDSKRKDVTDKEKGVKGYNG